MYEQSCLDVYVEQLILGMLGLESSLPDLPVAVASEPLPPGLGEQPRAVSAPRLFSGIVTAVIIA